jgi:hypothetical protein
MLTYGLIVSSEIREGRRRVRTVWCGPSKVNWWFVVGRRAGVSSKECGSVGYTAVLRPV